MKGVLDIFIRGCGWFNYAQRRRFANHRDHEPNWRGYKPVWRDDGIGLRIFQEY